ncbi:MAG: putative ORFan [Satyrvirus sp.]|uniref:Putative ORFan n=1 Tax=Satyrvirus sp. TaxID=2487771 RepID=A0A3G5AE45_9VIRU|nr:MAG: putative ORFan [Satyrvirus sp.]
MASTIPENILDLDTSESISDYEIAINTMHLSDTIYKLIELIKMYSKYLESFYREIGEIHQYILKIKYLNIILPYTFEFDQSYQYINIILYNDDQSKTYLKLFLSINDDPTIKYIENDRSNYVPSYHDKNIDLKPGEYLVHFCHQFITYIGFPRTRLDDDSYLITTDFSGNKIKTKLWLYLLVTKGKSWYAKFGYEPGNCNINEYMMKISDVQFIKLGDVAEQLKTIQNASKKQYFDKSFLEICQNLVEIIGESNETLVEYAKNHSLEEFTLLTHNLTQSVFSRKNYIEISSVVEFVKFVEFKWFEKCRQLFFANVSQINNNVKNHFYKLKKIE